MTQSADQALTRLYEEDSGKILSILIAQFEDFDLAEEAVQDAIIQATTQWREHGVPSNPGAWLLTTARRRAIDRIRRSNTRKDPEKIRAINDLHHDSEPVSYIDDEEIPDQRLRLIFTCCHPVLPRSASVALTLKTLCGLSVGELSRAFLVKEKTMNQRLVRAKNKIKKAGIPFEVPERPFFKERLDSVLAVIYLIYNEGYVASEGSDNIRTELTNEAIRLSELLFQLLPEPETGGLLALMWLHDARRQARMDNQGHTIALDQQDRSLWNQDLIQKGETLLHRCLHQGQPGKYQIQAAISALHNQATTYGETDWAQIAGLYTALYEFEPSPVISLNRAVALSYAGDLTEGLKLLETLSDELSAYQPYHAALADMLKRSGRYRQACQAYQHALTLTQNSADRHFLEQRLKDTMNQIPLKSVKQN